MANLLRDKVTGKFAKNQMQPCQDMAIMPPLVPQSSLLTAAARVDELKGQQTALLNRQADLENEYEQLDKQLSVINTDLEKARCELSRLM